MAIDPFSRRSLTPEEWRARARLIQEQLQGLSIAELMRGAVKRGGPSGHDGRGYDPSQPRVSAGHSDGGQWTNKAKAGGERINDPRILSDETPDNLWIIGADYAAGHHYPPRQAWQNLPLRPETRRVFEKAVSGPLPDKVWSRREQRWLRHAYDQRHREYNIAVSELIHNYMRANRIRPRQMTPEQAEEIVQAIFASSDPRIRRYNYMINVMRRYIRRFGGRGGE